MHFPSECPTDQQLLDYAAGHLPAAAAESLRQHLSQCTRCFQTVTRFRADPTDGEIVVDEAETPLFPAATEDHPADGARVNDEKFDATVLEPSDNREALGRFGKYDVLGVLGSGGMGVVLRGLDTQLCRPVAIKLLNRVLSSSAVARQRFMREARAAAAINHTNVVTIYAVEEYRNTPVIVMELVSGGTLRDRIQKAGRLEPFEVLRISTQVAAGLAAAHAQGVIHRDVKPGNILLEEQLERTKLTDFGVARAALDQVDLTSHGMAVGTPAYMAPEQVRGEKIDARADLFGLGCVMYAMFVGHSPFHGRNTWEMARLVNELEPRPLHELDPSIPKFLSEIVTRLLKKEPDERYQSAAEVSDVLCRRLALLNQTPSDQMEAVLHHRDPPPDATPPKRRFSWWLAAAVLLLLGGGVAAYWLPRLLHVAQVEPREPLAAPPPAARPEITVAKQQQADVQTIGEALAKTRPGTRIRVLDDAVYEEAVGFEGPDKYDGVELVSEAGATLASPPGSAFCVLGIKNTPRVTVRGFKIRPAPAQHGVAILGACPGTRLENCQLAATEPEHWALVFVTEHASGTAKEPILVQACTIQAATLGLVIQGDHLGPAKHVEVRNSRFEGPGQQLQLNQAVQGVTLTGNVFIKGTAIVCNLNSSSPVSDALLTNNTFFANVCWLDLSQSGLVNCHVRVCNNLIVGAKQIATGSYDPAGTAGAWTFSHNLWEPDAAGAAVIVATVAQPAHGLQLVSRDVGQTDFLRPTADSQAAQAGAGGDLPTYVGAVPPVATPEK